MKYNALKRTLAKGGAVGALLFCFAVPTQAQEMPAWAAPSQEGPAVSDRAASPSSPQSMDDPPPFPTPLDPAGLALLAVAGGALAARRLRERTPARDEG